MPTRITLVRHGQTRCNQVRRHQLPTETLSDLGHEQAKALAHRLAGERFDALYCSDLDRARQTAEPIAAAVGLAVRLEPRLREIDTGAYAGRLPAECEAEFPGHYALWRRADPDAPCPGGESWRDVQSRAGSFLDEVRRRHRDEHIVVVTHGGTLRCLLTYVLEIPLEHATRIATPNTACNVLTCDGEGPLSLSLWACVRHLEGVPARSTPPRVEPGDRVSAAGL